MSNELAEDMAVLGISDEIADAPSEDDFEPAQYEVWTDNWKSLYVFLALETQWEMVYADGYLIRTGINYERIEIVMRNANGIPRRQWSGIFADIRNMERAALRTLNQERKARMERDAAQRTWQD